MKKIILASASPQRKRLMKLLGLPFVICPSAVKEIHDSRHSCSTLVKTNALLKAQDIARNQSQGIVIGSDTLVTLGKNKIVGKPRTLDEAKKNLYELSRHPSWVYTGVAVIDVTQKRKIVDYEKTKVLMQPLSKKEIDRYYQKMSPLDKAGGFDIEGHGSQFIRRIEGCYFNVVGLPVAKLAQMLKKMGVVTLSLFFLFNVIGCATEYNLATKREETLFYSTEKEVKLGDNIARQFEHEFKFMEDMDQNERVNDMLRKITEVCDRQELVYAIKIIDEDKINAVSLPGGYVYVYRGLLEKITDDDQVAAVIAHEVGHITAKHSVKKIQTLYGFNLLQILSLQTGSGQFAQGMNLAFASVFLAYSREDEFEADRLAIKYLEKAGYRREAAVDALKKLQELEAKEPPRPLSYWRTHPYLSQRIAAANQVVKGSLEFRDYLNLTGEDK